MPEILAAHDINSRAESHGSYEIPVKTGNPILDANLFDLSRRFSGEHDPDVVLQMLATVMTAAASPDMGDHDLHIMNKSLDEMMAADKMFYPFRNYRKVSCFGSARIKPDDPAYIQAREFSALARANEMMVITGGGPGIMQACNEGAGEAYSFGLNITLPFEQHPNPVMAGSKKMMDFYYFFTRKLNFLKQTDALVAFSGGFGTMDEIFESITLIQTGKSTIFPIVLLDPPGRMFWARWFRFIAKELLGPALISPEDMALVYLSKSPEDAMAHILKFYSRYHSYYFDGDLISIRLSQSVPQENIDWMLKDYTDIIPKGDVQQLPNDANDPEPLLAELPRLRFTFNRGNYARLRELIDVIND